MKLLLLTDIHGNTENLEKILDREDYDSILCAGDLSDANEFDDYEENLESVLDTFNKKGKLTKAIPGNMDPEETCVRRLIDHRLNLHKKIASFEKFEAVGFGGGNTPFNTPFEPDGSQIKNAISTLYDRMTDDTLIAVVHQPPKNTKVDIADGEHVGSQEVRELFEENHFDLVVTGHIHESRGIDTIKDTSIVNPGPVMEGYYAVAKVEDGIEVELKQL